MTKNNELSRDSRVVQFPFNSFFSTIEITSRDCGQEFSKSLAFIFLSYESRFSRDKNSSRKRSLGSQTGTFLLGKINESNPFVVVHKTGKTVTISAKKQVSNFVGNSAHYSVICALQYWSNYCSLKRRRKNSSASHHLLAISFSLRIATYHWLHIQRLQQRSFLP